MCYKIFRKRVKLKHKSIELCLTIYKSQRKHLNQSKKF